MMLTITTESVTIPNSVTSIGDYAFTLCSALETVNIVKIVETIWNYAFSLCSSLKNIIIPSSVTYIEYNPFGS